MVAPPSALRPRTGLAEPIAQPRPERRGRPTPEGRHTDVPLPARGRRPGSLHRGLVHRSHPGVGGHPSALRAPLRTGARARLLRGVVRMLRTLAPGGRTDHVRRPFAGIAGYAPYGITTAELEARFDEN